MADASVDNTKKNFSFDELVEQKIIRIPKIQRDYAQGRKNDVVNDIRDKFVHTIVNAISNGAPMELDFIYGSNRAGAFEPLDGQQRLTTLFLFHWMLGYNLYDESADASLLTYKTRITSSDFCLELVKHSAEQFRKEAEAKCLAKKTNIENCQKAIDDLLGSDQDQTSKEFLNALKLAKSNLAEAKASKDYSVSDIIRNREWFDYLWSFDPTIQSMLVMIDSIWEDMDWDLDLKQCLANLKKITFKFLNLGEFGLSDELFIKMNARGKQLSSFDFVKSTIEEEIQIQKKEQHCDSSTEENWRSLIDGKWIDWFWNMYASPHIDAITSDPEEYKVRLAYAKSSEEYLKYLILRVINIEFLRASSLDDSLTAIAYDDGIDNLDRVFTIYQDSLKKQRYSGLIPDKEKEIDFQKIIKDINCLFYRDDNDIYHSVFDLIPKEYSINCDYQNVPLLAFALNDNFPNDCKVIFYAALRYLENTPIIFDGENDTKGTPAKSWADDFTEWVHVCRNIFIIDNNNIRIDSCKKLCNSFDAVDLLVDELIEFRKSLDYQSIRDFFASLKGRSIVGIDNQSLNEETEKAILKADSVWVKVLDLAESNTYLWGQIRCLLDWANGDLDAFNNYFEKLSALLAYQDKNRIRAAILCVEPTYGFSSHRLYIFNKDRDNSIKRYLRDLATKNTYGYYGYGLKSLVDHWSANYSTLEVGEFIDALIASHLSEPNSYRKCIIALPDIQKESWNKMMFTYEGHAIFAQKKTEYSHCFDIAILYIWYKIWDDPNYSDVQHFDSVGISYQYAITFGYQEHKYRIQQIKEGKYELYQDASIIETFENESKLLDYTKSQLNIN